MGGKGGSTPKSTSTTAKPYLTAQVKDAANYATDLFKQGAPAYYPNSTIATPSTDTKAALDAISARASAGSPLIDEATTNYLATLRGDYLNANPNLDNVIASTTADTTNNFLNKILPSLSSNFASSGRYGSGIQESVTRDAVDATAQSIADTAGNLRYQNYNDERQRQMQAASIAPTLQQAGYYDATQQLATGQARDALEQARIDADRERYDYGANAANNVLDQYISRIGALNSGGGTQTTTAQTSGNKLLSAASGGLAGGLGGYALASAFPTTFGLGANAMGATGLASLGALGPIGAGALLGASLGLFG